MTTKKNFVDIIYEALEKEAWNEVSKNSSWREGQLKRFKDRVDWKRISENRNIKWTTSMLEEFKHLVDWRKLSSVISDTEIIEKYTDKWDWKRVSENRDIEWTTSMLEKFKHLVDWRKLSSAISDIEIIDKYIEKWDWNEIINNYLLEECFDKEFIIKYIDYIPVDSLSNSRLWNCVIEKEAEKQYN
ncbi:MAG TPA: hypothetical protein PKW37_02430 [Salinivirgaceae bacterium]|nr:hypothetical protein [Salinivirgaceae bacterium]